jgi:hypothetical protein
MAEEEQAELSAFHNPSLSLSLCHTHYHLKSFLSSKPFLAFMYRHYKNSRNIFALKNEQKKQQKTEAFFQFSAQCGPRSWSSKMTCRRMKESSKEFKEQRI